MPHRGVFDFAYNSLRHEIEPWQIPISHSSYFRSLAEKLKEACGDFSSGLVQSDWQCAFALYSPFFMSRLKQDGFAEVLDPQPYIYVSHRQKLLDLLQQQFNRRVPQLGVHLAQQSILAEIFLLDIYRQIPFVQITQMISLLAKVVTGHVLKEIWQEVDQPMPTVIAMGKLGAEEVNYSSDIDLLFVSADEADLQETTRGIQRLMQRLSHTTQYGFLYRVDARLRPQGQSGGQLVRPIHSYMRYYTQLGQTWERQALLKASFLCGDESLGKEFIDEMQNFVFSRKVTPAEIREVKDIKGLIESDLYRSQTEDVNIKLMSGGIRDIEFLLQLMQLYHGYVYQELRNPNHLQVSKILLRRHFLYEAEEATLSRAYILFREIEHRLQLKQFSPVRELPSDPVEWDKLAYSLSSYESGQQLQEDIEKLRSYVRESFDRRLQDTIRFLEKITTVYDFLSQYNDANIAHFLHGFRDEYLDFFTPIQMADHYHRSFELDWDNPVSVFVDPDPKGSPQHWIVSLVALDRPFIFSYLMGEMSISGLQLEEAKSFSYRSHLHKRQQLDLPDLVAAPMVSHFKVRGTRKQVDTWSHKMAEIFMNTDPRDPTKIADYKLDLRRRFFARERTEIAFADYSHDFRVQVFNMPGSDTTALEITGRDYEGFLYESIAALQEMGLKILECDVDTYDGLAYDRFLISRLDDRAVSDEQVSSVERRLYLMRFFSRHLNKVADPAIAFQEFFDLVGKISRNGEDNGEEDFYFSSDLMEKVGLLLGSGEFVRQRFFLSEGLYFLKRADETKELNMSKHINKLKRLPSFKKYSFLLPNHNEPPKFPPERWQELSDEVLTDLNNWRESVLYDIILAQVQGYIPFNKLSVYFDEIITHYMKYFVQSQEKVITQEFGIDWQSWVENTRWAVVALGKYGGRELGYGSDLEIIFVYEYSEEWRDRPAEIWYKIVRHLVKTKHIVAHKMFEIDLRLRPHGKSGPLATSLRQFKSYYAINGSAHSFERQALIKGRVVAQREWSTKPSTALKEQIDEARRNFCFAFEPLPLSDIRQLHEQQIQESHRDHLKSGTGGLVEIEYSVQHLQMAYASRKNNSALRSVSTITVLNALEKEKVLSFYEANMLRYNYALLRIVINGLRFSIGRDDAYILPEPGTPSWSRLWRLVMGELNCRSGDLLVKLIESARGEIKAWWEDYAKRLPQQWQDNKSGNL